VFATDPLTKAEQVLWGWLGTFIAQSRNTSTTSTEHGHTRGLDRGFQGGPSSWQPGLGEEGSSRLPSSADCTKATVVLCELGFPRTTSDEVCG